MAVTNKKQKKVFTTGEVARTLSVNINTVIKWFDEGKIDGFRLPMSNDRRIPSASLRRFMIEHAIPLDLLDDEGPARRQYERINCDHDVSFTVSNGDAYGPYRGRLLDLSRGGARLMAKGDSSISIPTHSFRLDVSIENDELIDTSLAGNIVHLSPGGGDLSIGMKFAEMQPEHEARLLKYLETKGG